MDIKEAFAQRLIELREDKNVTQQILADDLGITRQSLSLYEKADRAINIELLYKIAKYFNVSADYLLGSTDNKTTDTNLQAVCDYTGLSEKAVKNLTATVELDPNEKLSKEKREMLLKILSNSFKIRNDFIASDWFWDIIGYISELDIFSEQWEETFITNLRAKAKGDNFNSEEIGLSQKCDVRRYLITQKINEYINFYDKRIAEENKIIISGRYSREKQLEEKFLKESSKNGKHNPPEE